MILAAGQRLGPYAVVAPLGAGGMREVYRATDTKLGREVAIKVLPADFARDADRLARFEREARRVHFPGGEGLTRVSVDGGLSSRFQTAGGLRVGAPSVVFQAPSCERSLPAAVELWRRLARNTIVKLGPRGGRWVSAGLDLRARPPRVRVVDTTGAGDAFNGGFLHALLGGAEPAACLALGNRVGALSTRAAGGIGSLPSRAEVGR